MASILAESADSSDTNPVPQAQTRTGPFMLTLFRLAEPVSIRPPQSPQLRPFTFFTSRVRQPDGSDAWYLHMGYFQTLSDAEKWAHMVRGRYPQAVAAIAPSAVVRPSTPERPVQSADSPPVDLQHREFAPVEGQSLTDTQVLRILDRRGVGQGQDPAAASSGAQIALLRPDDTSTRHALKEAVVQGAPVSFAVQLYCSDKAIDLTRVPSHAAIKAHTLYATGSRREGRCRYFLRLGFFGDPISAREVAAQLRSKFASAAVVPVTEREVTRAREAITDGSSIPYLADEHVDPTPELNGTPATPAQSKPLGGRKPARPAETLEQTLEKLAAKELWNDPDSLSETGVRHLKVEMKEGRPDSRRS